MTSIIRKAVFDFGMRKQICFANPALDLLAEDYFKYCDLTTKTNEERSFSREEIEKLRRYLILKFTAIGFRS